MLVLFEGYPHQLPAGAYADAYGPGSITDLEVVFSQFGTDKDGKDGPGKPGDTDNPPQGGHCHFIYYPASNTIYLDNQDGKYHDFGSAVVGSGGDLSNGYCTIHAGSANSKPLPPEAKVLSVSLDISFLPGSSHQYIYQFAYDQSNDLYTYSGAWYYWGWWLAQ